MHQTIAIGRNQLIFLRMLSNCMKDLGLPLPLPMDDIRILMPDDYNEAQQWAMLVSLHAKELLVFNPMTGHIVDFNSTRLSHVITALRKQHCDIYDYYHQPFERNRRDKTKQYRFWWTKTAVKVPMEPSFN